MYPTKQNPYPDQNKRPQGFNTNGAIKSGGYTPVTQSTVPTTPQAKALALHDNPFMFGMFPKAPPQINQPIKKQSVTQPDGTVIEHHYYDTKTGGLTPEGTSAGKPDVNASQSGSQSGIVNNQPRTPSNQNIVGSMGYDLSHDLQPGTSSQHGYNQNTNTIIPPTLPNQGYAGLVGNTAGASANAVNTGASNYNTANEGLLNATAGNQQYADRAKQITDTAGDAIKRTGILGVNTGLSYGNELSPIGEGNTLAANNAATVRENAIAAGANMQLSGNSQGLTAQNQTQSGYNQAAGNALNSQGQGITGLGTATGYAQPILGQYGQNNYNPVGGNSSGGITGVPANDINTLSQAVSNGQMTYQDALSQLSGYGTAVQNQLLPAIQRSSPGFNINTSTAQQSTRASNLSDLMSQLNTINSTSPAFDANVKQLQDFAGQGGLDTNVPILSALTKAFGESFANNPVAAGLLAKIASVNSLYKQITGVGGTLDPERMTVAGLNTKLKSMQDDITNKKQALSDQQSRLNSSNSSGSNSSSANPWH